MFQKIALGAASISMLVLTGCTDDLGDRYVSFAQCLTEKNFTMYGAYWCPHCLNQKKMFGKEGFTYVNYVECDPRGADANPDLCLKKGVERYPTWEFPDGKKVEGEIPLEVLSEQSGCPLPKESTEG